MKELQDDQYRNAEENYQEKMITLRVSMLHSSHLKILRSSKQVCLKFQSGLVFYQKNYKFINYHSAFFKYSHVNVFIKEINLKL